jgi:hypothetical protein
MRRGSPERLQMGEMEVIPKGTLLYAPDEIHRVTLQFPSENDAIIFYEWVKSVTGGKRIEKLDV